MPHVTLPLYDSGAGALVTLLVGPDEHRRRRLKSALFPDPGLVAILAQVETGAPSRRLT